MHTSSKRCVAVLMFFICVLCPMDVVFSDNTFDLSVSRPLAPTEGTPFTLEVLSPSKSSRTAYSIYIYHTHTYEAYEQVADAPYKETEKWRTADNAHNVVRVGEELSSLLERAGFAVYHDTTAYEPPTLSTAYSRSLSTLQETISQGKTYDLYIDLHRDSYTKNNGKNTVSVSGNQAARLLFLVGKGSSNTFDEKPNWEKNLKVATFIEQKANEQVPDLFRQTKLQSSRYNQHVADTCLLLEVGNNKNTLQEALFSLPPLVQGICAYFDSL